jgi:hypothetical protein
VGYTARRPTRFPERLRSERLTADREVGRRLLDLASSVHDGVHGYRRPTYPQKGRHGRHAHRRSQPRRRLGGVLVIAGIVLAILLGHWWIGLTVILVGLILFGGFAKGKWY